MTLAELKDYPVSRLVPHAAPMLLIDRVVSISDERFEAEAALREDSLFCDGEKMDAWIGIEYMAQAAAAYAGAESLAAGEPVKTGLLLGSRNYECREPSFKAGSVLRIGVRKVLHEPGQLSVVECSLKVLGEPEDFATATLTVYLVDDFLGFLARRAP